MPFSRLNPLRRSSERATSKGFLKQITYCIGGKSCRQNGKVKHVRGSFHPQTFAAAKSSSIKTRARYLKSSNSTTCSHPEGKAGGSCQLPPSLDRISSLSFMIGRCSQNPLRLPALGPSKRSSGP